MNTLAPYQLDPISESQEILFERYFSVIQWWLSASYGEISPERIEKIWANGENITFWYWEDLVTCLKRPIANGEFANFEKKQGRWFSCDDFLKVSIIPLRVDALLSQNFTVADLYSRRDKVQEIHLSA